MLINQADDAGMADLRGAGQGRLAPHRQVTEAPQKELVIKVRELDAGRMPWTAPQIIRQQTPYVAGERPMLEAWLEFRRQTLLSKCSGLTAAQLQQ